MTPAMKSYAVASEALRPGNGRAWDGAVLVTGAAGFLGRHLVQALSRAGAEVRAVDNMCVPPMERPPRGLRRLSVLDLTARDFDGVSCVYHLAAWKSVPGSFSRPERCVENIRSGEQILRLALTAGVARVIIASSCEVYGVAKLPNAEDAPLSPRSAYAMAKASVDLLAAICRQNAQDVVVARLFNTYGPGERPDAVIPAFCRDALTKGTVLIEGSGRQRRDFSYLTDTVARLIELSAIDEPPGVINIGSGESHSILALAALLAKKKPGTTISFGSERPHEIGEFRADMTLGRKVFSPRHPVSLEEGLAETFSWWEWCVSHA
jgi:nucleoside-diphosphate-sugar epimerase